MATRTSAKRARYARDAREDLRGGEDGVEAAGGEAELMVRVCGCSECGGGADLARGAGFVPSRFESAAFTCRRRWWVTWRHHLSQRFGGRTVWRCWWVA